MLGTPRLLTFNLTRITRHEAFCAERLLVVGVDFNECASDGETERLALAGEATTVKVHLDVILLSGFKQREGLLHHELKDRGGEIFGEITLVDCDFTGAFREETRATALLRRPNALIISIVSTIFT